MEDKYYTPELSELNVEFEYEESRRDGRWVKINDFSNAYDYEDSCLYGFIKALEAGRIRVKYLDAEGMMELGFKEDTSDFRPAKYTKGALERKRAFLKDGLIVSWFDSQRPYISIESFGKEAMELNTLYAGQCKNKSKLKQILKDTMA